MKQLISKHITWVRRSRDRALLLPPVLCLQPQRVLQQHQVLLLLLLLLG